MIEFTGTYIVNLDDKGRVVLPATLKKEMGEHALEPLVIERNLFKECLDIYPEKLWQDRVIAFKSTLDPFDEEDDEFLQFFYENFQKVAMAPNGRISISPEYRNYGNFRKKVLMIGMGSSIRMWDTEEYEKTKMDRSRFSQKFKEKRKNKTDGQ